MAGTVKKVFGDGQVVKVKKNYSEGLTDIMSTKDTIVAVCEEVVDLYAMVDDAADFDELKAAMAARGPLKYITFVD